MYSRLKLLQFSSLQMYNTGNHCRTGASASSWVQLGRASQLHSMMAYSGPSGAVLNYPDGYAL